MPASKKPTRRAWKDPDDAPDLSSKEWKKKLDSAPVARGRPKVALPKQSTTIRLDPDVIAFFKKGGEKGWQSRINEALREAAGLDK